MSIASLVVSLDTELGWGAIDNGLWRMRQQAEVYTRTRPAVERLLGIMDALEAPATWAFVGGLLERPGEHRLEHLPARRRTAVSAALAAGREDTFRGEDLLDRVLARRVSHEIASHTYSHTRFRDAGVDAGFVHSDLAHVNRLLTKAAAPPSSLIFPSNEEAFEHEVRACGYGLIRGAPPHTMRPLGALQAAWEIPPTAAVTTVAGLSRVGGSMLFNARHGRLHRVPLVMLRAARGLAHAVHAGGIFHVWTHPFNFATSRRLLDAFEWFLRRAAAERDRGRVRIVRMVDVAAGGDGARHVTA